MHRLRTRRRAKENESAPRKSNESEVPALPTLKSRKTFRRNKTAPTPVAPALDLTNALPPTDDFRTSLLMPKLSARFSVLRDGSDKNSDDGTVLFGKDSQATYGLGKGFVFPAYPNGGLSDIAEVSSIRGSAHTNDPAAQIRPPFAFGRKDSDFSGYGTDDDSTTSGGMMNRSKPGEGNNLFGGRQKVYKIPVGASSARSLPAGEISTSDAESSGPRGRAVYEDDVSESAFQRQRRMEREREREWQLQLEREEAERQEAARASSPQPAEHKPNRNTSSSTTSGHNSNTRVSTAATSINSQGASAVAGTPNPFGFTAPPSMPTSPVTHNPAGLDRAYTKSKRPLYEQGLDQQLHEQQSLAVNRLDLLSRQRAHGAGTPPLLHYEVTHAKSTSNLHDRYTRARAGSNAASRAASPTPAGSGLNSFNFGTFESKSAGASPIDSPNPNISHSPAVNQSEDEGEPETLSVFARQKRYYDEQQYTQRQIQMHAGGRETPELRGASRLGMHSAAGRPRGDSNASLRFRSESAQSNHRAYFMQSRSTTPVVERREPPTTGTFLDPASPSDDMSSRDSESETEKMVLTTNAPSKLPQPVYQQRPPQTSPPPQGRLPVPPKAQNLLGERFGGSPTPDQSPSQNSSPRVTKSNNGSLKSSSPLKSMHRKGPSISSVQSSEKKADDSPTLGPTGELSALVRQHLRSESGSSSIYDRRQSRQSTRHGIGSGSGGKHSASQAYGINKGLGVRLTGGSNTSGNGNQWEFEDWDGGYYGEADSMSSASPLHSSFQGNAPPPLKPKKPEEEIVERKSEESMTSYQTGDDLKLPTHNRAASTETQREREDFAKELAHRRKMVQETLKTHADRESRAASPVLEHSQTPPSVEFTKQSPIRAASPFANVLKPRMPSSSGGKQDGPSKAMRMLGISGNDGKPADPIRRKPTQDDIWKAEEDRLMRPQTNTPLQRPGLMPPRKRDESTDRHNGVNGINGINGHHHPGRENTFGLPPSPSPPRNGDRDRSASNSSGESRNGTPRGMVSPAIRGPETPGRKRSSPPQPFLDQHPAFSQRSTPDPQSLGRPRGNSKTVDSGRQTPNGERVNGKAGALMPLQVNHSSPSLGLVSPRPSPLTPYSANSTPSLNDSPMTSTTPTFSGNAQHSMQTRNGVPKKPIKKSDISEPTLISSTSTIDTVNLPRTNGSLTANNLVGPPELPPINPRRRMTTTKTFFAGLTSRSETPPIPPSGPRRSDEELRSTFSGDEKDSSTKYKKLRKSSSEGGNLNARAKEHMLAQPSPAVPLFPPSLSPNPNTPNTPKFEGGMF